jgi:predicted nucleic acid-binding protein
MPKPKVYIETTIVSYLTAWPSRDLIVAAHQQLTQEWWEHHSTHFDVFISQLIIQEASAGDEQAAQRRLRILEQLPILELREDAVALARALMDDGPIPQRSVGDALHIAIATVHGMDFLLTWNCVHIANAVMRNAITSVCRSRGYDPPVICTPEELMEG